MTSLPDMHAEIPRYLLDRAQAQRNDRLIQIVAVVIGVVFLATTAILQRPINQQRAKLQLVTHADIKYVPPKYAWATAVAGPFRALAVDILWIRLDQQKEEGKYAELDQISRWICTLYPRFSTVWANMAWNMSYNISVATHTPEERWNWVYGGIRLLRDEGIPNNPRAIGLYKELSWIIFHKVGDMLDDMHFYYKREWAAIFENLLGAPPLTASAQVVVDTFRPIAEAPAAWDAFAARHPDILPHVDALRAAGVDVHAKWQSSRGPHPLETSFFARYGRLIEGTELMLARYRRQAAPPDEKDRAFVEAFRAIPTPLADALVAYLRAKVLREQYRMDPAYMLSLMTNLVPGEKDLLVPLDWRLPESHAIYWSRYGVEQGRKLKNVSEADLLNTDRYTCFSLMNFCKRGRLVFELNRDKPNRSALSLLPDLRMVAPMHRMFLALGPVHADPGENVGRTAGEMLKSGHINTLEEAIVLFYARGDRASAEQYYAYLRDNYKEIDGSTKQRYLIGLDAFVLGEVKSLSESYKDALALIHSFLSGAMLSLAEGDGTAHARQVERAQFVWKTYMADKADDRQGRLRLPPFNEMRGDALRDFLVYTPSLLLRATVWQAEDTEIKRFAWRDPDVAAYLKAQCEARGYDDTKAFPEPPGMAEFRKAHPEPTRPEEEQLATPAEKK